jgi:hypothetical protein
MGELVVVSDSDWKAHGAKQEMADFYGRLLAETYPGYRWRVEPHPHPTHPFVDIRVEAGGGALGFTVCPRNHFSYTDIRNYVIMQAGETLERHLLNRRRFNEREFLERPKTFGGFVLPHLDGVKGV